MIRPSTETSPPEIDDRPTAEIVRDALVQWESVTGISLDTVRWKYGDWNLREMNQEMIEALRLDPEGTTTYLLLECFLRDYLEQKTFTCAQIMKDYAGTSAYLAKAEELFRVVQSERACEIAAAFRQRVLDGVRHYQADRPEVRDMIENADILPFLRRDALFSLNSLKPYQFLAGEPDPGIAQVIGHVYLAWNVNDLLLAVRDMPVSGVAVVLMKDPAHADRSYFTFAMRNGGNVVLFTDKTKPVYPGQEDVLAQRGGRGIGRTFAARAWANHFPYQLIKRHTDEETGDIIFDEETAPVAAGLRLVPMMPIAELPAHQVIWLTMMLSLIADKFWKHRWQAPEISYTGAMVRAKALLVTDTDGITLPAALTYRSIELDDIEVADLTASALAGQTERPAQGVNAWLEERYRSLVSRDVVNQWQQEGDTQLYLPAVTQDRHFSFGRIEGVPSTTGAGILAAKNLAKQPQWMHPNGYTLLTFSPTAFGTEEEVKADRLWIARHNMAKHIQRSADLEFEARKNEISAWYLAAVRENLSGLLDLVRQGKAFDPGEPSPDEPKLAASKVDAFRRKHPHNMLRFAALGSAEWHYDHCQHNCLGDYRVLTGKRHCVLTDAVASFRAKFTPHTAQGLALLAGCRIDQLPDVLQNWFHEKPYVGNHLLDRLDPVETLIHDPWMRMHLDVNIFLSKRGHAQVLKGAPLAETAAPARKKPERARRTPVSGSGRRSD